MELIEYIVTLASLHEPDKLEDSEARIKEFRDEHKDKVATFGDVETAIQVMVSSILKDQSIGEQVQGVFNQSLLEILEMKNIITQSDVDNVAEIMQQATMQLSNEYFGGNK